MDRSERIEQMRQKHRIRQQRSQAERRPVQREKRPRRWRKRALFFPLAILYMEIVLRIWRNQPFGGIGLLYTVLFSIGVGLVCNILVSLGPNRVRQKIYWVIVIFFTLLFMIQTVFYTIFRGYAEFGSLGVATAAITNFFGSMLQGIADSILPLLFLLLPLALFQALKLARYRPVRRRGMVRALVLVVVFHVLVISSVLLNTYGIVSPRSIYREHFTLNLAVPNFGLVTGMRLDLRYALFGQPEAALSDNIYIAPPPADLDPDPNEDENGAEPAVEIPTGYNVLDIDFEALLENETNATVREMHEFFMNRRATPRNEWTGRFEGYNLIWLMGEAFHTLAIHPEITPTLYRMANEGFQFTNFYTPDTGFSTTGGEFAMKLSLIPRHRNAFPNTATMYMPFGFGNMFRALGYETFAYHNWTYSFYRRDLSHPNLGYPWLGLGNGLPVERMWPTSDLEMMQVTVDDFIDADRFHVYYVTVSGHLEYNFGGNAMARRHQEAVEHLPYSVGPRAYLATHIELDLALAYLIERLDQADKLENTVFALASDHYPYGLSVAEMEELKGAPIEDPLIDVHHSTFILWSASMEEPVVVETYSSFYDVMPTLANLFNLPYDSRLIMGVDLLSGVDPFVPFASRSWVSQLGRFNSRTGQFTPHPHIDPTDIPENHVRQMASRFNVMEVYSVRILEHDYYRLVLGG